ncbi:unnamed protein product [Rhodiola kirilowii]
MSLTLLSVLPFYALVAFFSVILWIHNAKKCSKKLPPGSMGLPWIGETLEFYKAQRKNRLFEDFVQSRIAKHGKIFKTSLMGSATVIVNGAEANRFFLSNEFKLVVSSWPSSSVELMGRNSIMERRGREHQHIRRIIAKSLGYSGLEALVPKMCKSVQTCLDAKWSGREEVSLYKSTKSLTFTIVFECLLGIKVEEEVLKTFERVLEGVFAIPVLFPGSKFCKAKVARAEIERMLLGIVRKMRHEMEESKDASQKEESLLTKLVSELIHDEITEDEVIDNIILLVFAAHDTTSFAIAMTFRMLAHHPSCYDLLLREHMDILRSKGGEDLEMKDITKMTYTWQVAQESMRLFPPIFGSFRKALCDIEYQGFTIPKGWKVLWTTYGTHYNENYFKDPLSFDPSRFKEPTTMQPYVYLPFGGGPRVCAGYQLAKLHILIFVHVVVTQYNWSLLDLNEPIVVDPLPFPAHGMPINIRPKLF